MAFRPTIQQGSRRPTVRNLIVSSHPRFNIGFLNGSKSLKVKTILALVFVIRFNFLMRSVIIQRNVSISKNGKQFPDLIAFFSTVRTLIESLFARWR